VRSYSIISSGLSRSDCVEVYMWFEKGRGHRDRKYDIDQKIAGAAGDDRSRCRWEDDGDEDEDDVGAFNHDGRFGKLVAV